MLSSSRLVALATVAQVALAASVSQASSNDGVWLPNGCLIDSWNRALASWQFADNRMTQEMCQQACQAKGYIYAGLEYSTQCFCSNSVTYGEWSSGATTLAKECLMPCAGNSSQTCGAGFRLSSFKFSKSAVSSLPVASKISSSVTLVSSTSQRSTAVSSSRTSSTSSKTYTATSKTTPPTSKTSSTTSKTTTATSKTSTATSATSTATSKTSTGASNTSNATSKTSSATSRPSSVTSKASTATSKTSTASSVTSKGISASSAASSIAGTKSSSTAIITSSSSACKTCPSTTAKAPAATNKAKKAGLGWTSDSGTRFTDFTNANGSVVGWTYDWNSVIVPGTPLKQLEYVPMAWGAGSADGFARDSAAFKALGVSSLLSFNEPDQKFSYGGSQMTPAEAASAHQKIFNATLAAAYRIGSPAVARGGGWWMDQWVKACNGKCAYDFVPLHFYGTNAKDMISYIKGFIATYGKPVWVTEYACMDFGATTTICTLEEAIAFQKEVIHYMYNEPMVERYAAFGTFTSWASGGNPNGMLSANGAANELGLIYASAI